MYSLVTRRTTHLPSPEQASTQTPAHLTYAQQLTATSQIFFYEEGRLPNIKNDDTICIKQNIY
jgi:hypothetical protein